jgi:hypothetical protein
MDSGASITGLKTSTHEIKGTHGSGSGNSSCFDVCPVLDPDSGHKSGHNDLRDHPQLGEKPPGPRITAGQRALRGRPAGSAAARLRVVDASEVGVIAGLYRRLIAGPIRSPGPDLERGRLQNLRKQ